MNTQIYQDKDWNKLIWKTWIMWHKIEKMKTVLSVKQGVLEYMYIYILQLSSAGKVADLDYFDIWRKHVASQIPTMNSVRIIPINITANKHYIKQILYPTCIYMRPCVTMCTPWHSLWIWINMNIMN